MLILGCHYCLLLDEKTGVRRQVGVVLSKTLDAVGGRLLLRGSIRNVGPEHQTEICLSSVRTVLS